MTKKSNSILDRLPANRIQIHTDGSCKNNPGPGGFAAHIRRYEAGELVQGRIVKGGSIDTTNNRMELQGPIEALQAVSGDEVLPICVFADSSYVVNTMNDWLAKWKANGWKGSDKKPVKNIDLLRVLDGLTEGRNVRFFHVKGHSGDPMNEEVDQIAQEEAARFVQMKLEAELASLAEFADYEAPEFPPEVGKVVAAGLRITLNKQVGSA